MYDYAERTTDSMQLFTRSYQNGQKLKEFFCSYCAKAGIPEHNCYISETEIGGVDEKTGEIICKYCLKLIEKIKSIK